VGAASIDTLRSWTGAGMHSFGEHAGNNPGAVTFGQTFRITSGNVYGRTLSFMVDDYFPSTALEVCTFQALIMQWNGIRATGPVLFQSDPLVTHGGFGVWETFNVPLNDTLLVKDQPYVAIFTANNFLNGIRSDASMANTSNLYAGGGFVSHVGGYSIADLSAWDWYTRWEGSYDLAFRLTSKHKPVPEPAGGLLLAIGCGLWLLRGRKEAATRLGGGN